MDLFNDVFGANHYGMFTDKGDALVANLVDRARAEGWNWERTYQELCRLSEQKDTGEATDTEVREIVYCKLGFDKTGESFWC